MHEPERWMTESRELAREENALFGDSRERAIPYTGLTGYQGGYRDVDRKGIVLMEEHLSKLIFDSISDGVFTVDKDCIITSFNTSAEKITGFDRRETVGKYCFDVFRTEICHKHCPLKDTLVEHKPIEDIRVTIITKEGCEVPIRVTTTVLRDEDGRPVGAIEFFRDITEIELLRDRIERERSLENIICTSRQMREILNLLPDIAESECNVLVQGPSGSGKELISQAIHNLSPRKYGPYIKINCAALPAPLLESELFGYVKGAFTDAKRDKPGMFCLAKGGTLLLDEIGEMDLALQVKLLRVLNNGEFQPLGSTQTMKTDARIITSTNADLRALIKVDRFREDLFFRINVVEIEIPPLEERPEDILPLVEHFIRKIRRKNHKPIKGVSPEAYGVLRRYPFPGNVRELENALEHAFVMCHEEFIQVEHLPHHILEYRGGDNAGGREPARSEKEMIREALQRYHGNRKLTAMDLGMHRSTLWRKIKMYQLDR